MIAVWKKFRPLVEWGSPRFKKDIITFQYTEPAPPGGRVEWWSMLNEVPTDVMWDVIIPEGRVVKVVEPVLLLNDLICLSCLCLKFHVHPVYVSVVWLSDLLTENLYTILLLTHLPGMTHVALFWQLQWGMPLSARVLLERFCCKFCDKILLLCLEM